MSDMLQTRRTGDCWTLTLHREDKMNALNADLVEALIEEVGNARAAGARVIVFRGAGRNFSAGFDSGELERQTDGDLLLRFVRIETLLNMVAVSPCLSVAFAHGRNFGAGVDLFAACRQRYCSSDATFRMPGLRFGLVLGTRRFAELVGVAHAQRILQESLVVGARQAESIGLATRLLEPEDWDNAISEATRIALALDPLAQQQLHQALCRENADRDLAALVRSAARPGLKNRIAEYKQGEADAARARVQSASRANGQDPAAYDGDCRDAGVARTHAP